MAVEQLYVTFRDGTKMPAMGLGTYMYTLQPEDASVVQMVETALEIGYRSFDTAQLYETEVGVGLAVRNKIASGLIKRPDVFITTKVWGCNARRNDVLPSLKKSLEKLGLDYVDLALVHWPIAYQTGDMTCQTGERQLNLTADTDYLETWQGMEECYDEGLAKSIGISNFNSKQIQRLLDNCRIKPANHQIESHPFFANKRLVDFCTERGITIAVYSPLMGFAPEKRAKKGWPTVYTDETLVRIGKKHNKTPAQVALRYQLQRGLAILPKSVNPVRMRENFEALSFQLTNEEMAEVGKCDRNIRICDAEDIDHPHYPFKEEF